MKQVEATMSLIVQLHYEICDHGAIQHRTNEAIYVVVVFRPSTLVVRCSV